MRALGLWWDRIALSKHTMQNHAQCASVYGLTKALCRTKPLQKGVKKWVLQSSRVLLDLCPSAMTRGNAVRWQSRVSWALERTHWCWQSNLKIFLIYSFSSGQTDSQRKYIQTCVKKIISAYFQGKRLLSHHGFVSQRCTTNVTDCNQSQILHLENVCNLVLSAMVLKSSSWGSTAFSGVLES